MLKQIAEIEKSNQKQEKQKRINSMDQEVAFLRIKDNSKISKGTYDNQTGLKALFISEINKMMEQSDDEEQVILQQALVYGIEAIEEEKVEISIEDV